MGDLNRSPFLFCEVRGWTNRRLTFPAMFLSISLANSSDTNVITNLVADIHLQVQVAPNVGPQDVATTTCSNLR